MDKLSTLRKRVKEELILVYSVYHGCALKKAERGMKKGRLCDDCLYAIDEQMKRIFH